MSKKFIKFVLPIPLDNIPSPWNETFNQLNKSPAPDSLLINKPAIQLHAIISDADWLIALYWVVKKSWNPKLKIPISRQIAKLYEPWGELFYQVLRLCIVCFDNKHQLSQRYVDPANWFLNIIREAKKIDTKIIIENEASGKNSIIEEKRDIIARLRDGQNPATEQTSPHYYRLIEVALSLQNSDDFNKNYWKPFMSACCKHIQAMEKRTCQETFVENNKILYRAPGSGKGTYTLMDLR